MSRDMYVPTPDPTLAGLRVTEPNFCGFWRIEDPSSQLQVPVTHGDDIRNVLCLRVRANSLLIETAADSRTSGWPQ